MQWQPSGQLKGIKSREQELSEFSRFPPWPSPIYFLTYTDGIYMVIYMRNKEKPNKGSDKGQTLTNPGKLTTKLRLPEEAGGC